MTQSSLSKRKICLGGKTRSVVIIANFYLSVAGKHWFGERQIHAFGRSVASSVLVGEFVDETILRRGTTVQNSLEIWKFRLQVFQTLLSVVGLIALLLAFAQWRASVRRDNLNTYVLLAQGWNNHLMTFVEKPDLRPYFKDGLDVSADDPLAQRVLAVAEVRLDLMDGLLTYISQQGWTPDETSGWQNTFRDAFASSPALCRVHAGSTSSYGLINPLARSQCSTR
ncbi:MAG: hypothetical protein AB3N23_05655 [Paracoccaceae bacterium]